MVRLWTGSLCLGCKNDDRAEDIMTAPDKLKGYYWGAVKYPLHKAKFFTDDKPKVTYKCLLNCCQNS